MGTSTIGFRFATATAVVLMFCLGRSVPVSAADAPGRVSWQRISSATWHTPLRLDAAGNLWLAHDRFSVSMFPAGDEGWPEDPESAAWRTWPLPIGRVLGDFVVSARDGCLYVATSATTGGRDTIHRFFPESSTWQELPVDEAISLLFEPRVAPDGSVWLGGERGEIFRLMGDEWVKEVTPLPLHTKTVVPLENGRAWGLATARLDQRVVYRDRDSWIRGAETPDRDSALLWADSTEAIVRSGLALYRCAPVPDGVLEPWVETGTSTVAASARDSVWAVKDRMLLFLEGTAWRELGEVPFAPLGLVCEGGLLFCLTAEGVWLRREGPPVPPPSPPLGMMPASLPHFPYREPKYGLGVLTLRDRPFLYVSRHETRDCVLPLRAEDAPAEWDSLSLSLGLDTFDESYAWAESYEMSVTVGDLNGDGFEDVLLTTMYDGVRMLRNVRDRRLVPWTEESGLGGRADEVCVDADLLDADADGDLDLYVATVQGPDRLYANDGAGRFTEITGAAGLDPPDGSHTALCRDLDGDGDTDVVVTTLVRGVAIHENLGPADGTPRFTTHWLLAEQPHPQVPSGLSRVGYSGVGAADVDGDGRTDLLLAARRGTPRVLRNLGGMRFAPDETLLSFAAGTVWDDRGVLCFDPDGDGDWDAAVTGRNGTHYLENRDGRLQPLRVGAGGFRNTGFSTASVLVDADGDGDLDLVDGGIERPLVIHENTNDPAALVVRVRGPAANRGGVGATVRTFHAGTIAPAASAQEVSGGDGYGSHGAKEIYVTGLDPAAVYDVQVRLPSGHEAWVRGTPGRGRVVVALGADGIGDRLVAALHPVKVSLLDRWGRVWWFATAAGAALVGLMGVRFARTQRSSYPWFSVPVVLALSIVLKLLIDAPKGLPVLAGPVAGFVGGMASLFWIRPGGRPVPLSALGEFVQSLRTFDHNQTPRMVIDRLRFLAANRERVAAGGERMAGLLEDDLRDFVATVLPEMSSLIEGARAADVPWEDGGRAWEKATRRSARLQGRLRVRAIDADALQDLVALVRAVEEFQRWIAEARRFTGARIHTPLADLVADIAASSRRIHRVRIEHEVAPVSVSVPPAHLKRVLEILIENSVEAGGDRRPGIVIRTRPPEGGRVPLVVKDDGPGIPAALRARIFEDGVSGAGAGRGFGLHAARRMLEPFGAAIQLTEDERDSGAAFLIGLPLHAEGDAL